MEENKASNEQSRANNEEQLDDDTLKNGITFSSFDITEVLGQGTFGKVFKVNLKSDTEK